MQRWKVSKNFENGGSVYVIVMNLRGSLSNIFFLYCLGLLYHSLSNISLTNGNSTISNLCKQLVVRVLQCPTFSSYEQPNPSQQSFYTFFYQFVIYELIYSFKYFKKIYCLKIKSSTMLVKLHYIAFPLFSLQSHYN